MANLNDFLKVLDFANAATTDSKMEQHFEKQLKSLFGFLSPNDKQTAKEEMNKKKRQGGLGMERFTRSWKRQRTTEVMNQKEEHGRKRISDSGSMKNM